MYKLTAWFSLTENAKDKPLIKRMFELFELSSGSVTEIINGTYCVDFGVKNSIEEIDKIESHLQIEYPDVDLKIEIEKDVK